MRRHILKSLVIGFVGFQIGFSATKIDAPQNLWYPATLTFDGPDATEVEATFRNYRLDVTFTKGTKSYKVPGYFAGDGNAAETSAKGGNKWRVKFTPDEPGTWNYSVSFRTGTDIAISLVAGAGSAVAGVDGETGSFTVGAYNPSAPGFYSKGTLRYVGEHFGQFAGSKEWHVKAGPGSPEDFFGYKDFDDTQDHTQRSSTTQLSDIYLRNLNGEGLHFYSSHVNDWKTGDPSWKGGKGKGIIGVLNYLSSIGVNAIYMISFTETDDSDNTWPWPARLQRNIYDVSKLDQWDIVFSHMDKVGIAPNLYLSEADNTKDLDGGNMTLQYPIYYREMIARFGYHLGVRYNIGEEPTMSAEQIGAAAERISKLEAHGHPIGVHSSHVRTDQMADYTYLLGKPYFHGAWMQLHQGDDKDHLDLIYWRTESAKKGTKWIVTNDEPWDALPSAMDKVERYTWYTYMAGAEGYLQYLGYKTQDMGDITLEDFRKIETSQKFIVNGKNLFLIPGINSRLPEIMPNDALVGNSGGNAPPYCLAKKGEVYIVYKTSSVPSLNLAGESGSFNVKWYDPRSGGALQSGSVSTVTGGGSVSLGNPPKDAGSSWVAVVSKVGIDLGTLVVPTKTPVNRQSHVAAIHSLGSQNVKFFLPENGQFKVSLYDLSGMSIGNVFAGQGEYGMNVVPVNIAKSKGQMIFAKLEFKGKVTTKQLVILDR